MTMKAAGLVADFSLLHSIVCCDFYGKVKALRQQPLLLSQPI